MTFLRPAALALALIAIPATFAVPALAQDQGAAQQRPGGGFFRSLSPEQRMMAMVEIRKATADMTDDQKQAYRQSQRQKFMAMSDSDRTAYAAKLQSDWNALSGDQKTQIQQEMAAWRAQRMQQGGGMGQGQGAGH